MGLNGMIPPDLPPPTPTDAAPESTPDASVTPTRPYITVVVTAYRRKRYLRDAVRSAIDQTLDRSKYEIIVLKDFADPEIDGWLAGLSPPVRVVTEDIPVLGAMAARGFELARGEVVSLLDDDDRYRRPKLQGVYDLFQRDPRLVYVRNSCEGIDADGQPVPSWRQYRPQPPTSRTIDLAQDGEHSLPWVQRYGGHLNGSTMSLRAAYFRPFLRWLRQSPAAPDLLLFTAAALSRGTLRVEASVWNDYRVHVSTSHPGIREGGEALDLYDVRRSNVTAEAMRDMVSGYPDRILAQRFAEAFRLEIAISTFNLDPNGHLRPQDWVRFGRAIWWRRQQYLLLPWAYCIFRILRPSAAIASYRRYRFGELRKAAGVD